MASFNRVILLGNLTRDPEVRTTPGGTPVADIRLAVNETYRRKATNEKIEKVCFIDVTVWDQMAEVCRQYLFKGSPLLVEGRLQYDEWKNQQGETRSKIYVRADRIQLIGGGTRSTREDSPPVGGFDRSGGVQEEAPFADVDENTEYPEDNDPPF